MHILIEICARRDQINAIARRHKAEKFWVFGSCARIANPVEFFGGN